MALYLYDRPCRQLSCAVVSPCLLSRLNTLQLGRRLPLARYHGHCILVCCILHAWVKISHCPVSTSTQAQALYLRLSLQAMLERQYCQAVLARRSTRIAYETSYRRSAGVLIRVSLLSYYYVYCPECYLTDGGLHCGYICPRVPMSLSKGTISMLHCTRSCIKSSPAHVDLFKGCMPTSMNI